MNYNNRRLQASEFETLFRTHYECLVLYACGILGDDQLARDIVSDVFADLWMAKRELNISKAFSYLRVSVRNRCYDNIRQNGKMVTMPLDQINDSADSDSVWLEREHRIAKIEKRMNELPEKALRILQLHYRENMSYKDIASLMGMTVEGVKKNLYRTLRTLKDTDRNNSMMDIVHFLLLLSII